MRIAGLTMTLILAGCASPQSSDRTATADAAQAPLPAGATLGAGGYATLLNAPASPPPPRPSAGPASPGDERYRNPDEVRCATRRRSTGA
jgi:hypothetical protein